jgi:hypothetical protein
MVSMGVSVVREHFLRLSSADRAILAAEGIENLRDLIFYDWTERIIRRAHEQSEKISVLFSQESQSRTEQYRELFSKHLGRYVLGPHLTGALTFARECQCSQLQAAKLLAEAILLVETQRWFPPKTGSPVPPALLQITEHVYQQGRFDAAELEKLTAKLKSIQRNPNNSGQEFGA